MENQAPGCVPRGAIEKPALHRLSRLCSDCRFYEGDGVCGKPLRRTVSVLHADVAYEYGTVFQMRAEDGPCRPRGKMWRARHEAVWWRSWASLLALAVGGVFMVLAIACLNWGDVMLGKKETLK
jgi:hypothetical protein